MGYYIQPHITQFDGALRQGEACVPASLANGVGATTHGARRPSSGTIHALVPKAQEQSPGPGWSLKDADVAMGKIGIPFTANFDGTWAQLEAAHNAGKYLVIQGVSHIFSNNTCSGAFDGDHCIGNAPNEQIVSGVEYWRIDDPICKTWRWEKKSVIKAYAEAYAKKVAGELHFGTFTTTVPQDAVPAPKPPPVTLKYGGVASHGTKRIAVPAGRKAVVRSRPTSTANPVPQRSGGPLGGGGNALPNRTVTEFWQRTTRGQKLAGSSTWYGDRTGTRWIHSSAF